LNKYATKEKAKALSKETQVGLLFCYKALKRCEDDYQRAYDYLLSDEFRNSIDILTREPMTLLQIGIEDSLVLKETEICACIEKQEYVYSLEAIEEIALLTKGLGYDGMILAIYVGDDTAISISAEHRCYQKFLFDQIGKVLPIDYQNVIEAAACKEANGFEIYRKNS